jgi:hypothetical protein
LAVVAEEAEACAAVVVVGACEVVAAAAEWAAGRGPQVAAASLVGAVCTPEAEDSREVGEIRVAGSVHRIHR